MTLFARRSVALGLSPAIVPVSAWLVLGFLLGPAVLGVLSPDVLAHLDAAVSIALGTLGVFVGIALVPRARDAGTLVGAALLESGSALVIVFAAAAFLLTAQQVPLTSPLMLVALSLGAAAGASGASAFVEGQRTGGSDHAMHVADLDDVLPIVVAAGAMGLASAGAGSAWLRALGESIGIGLACGAIGLLLFERTTGEAERAVYVLGVLALIGGACAYAGVSPLLAGLCAGLFWRNMPGRADAVIVKDLRKFQHPLVVLLVMVAGAQATTGPLPVLLFAIFVVFRLSGKVIGGLAAARFVPALAGEVLGAYLVSPGVIGIAIALNLQQVAPADGRAVVSAVAAGALAFEIVSALVAPTEAG
jgi:hypothetical protein